MQTLKSFLTIELEMELRARRKDAVLEKRRGLCATKLDVEKAADIRRRLRLGESQASLSQLYGVDDSVIQRIASGKVWADGSPPIVGKRGNHGNARKRKNDI